MRRLADERLLVTTREDVSDPQESCEGRSADNLGARLETRIETVEVAHEELLRR